jgi:negative regulator of sigma E activity
MPQHPDATVLFRSLLEADGGGPFDPDSPTARASLERILAASPLPASRHRPSPVLRFALTGAAASAVLAAVIVVRSLEASRSGLAQAAVIARAAAALDQPNTILYLRVQDYSAHGRVICVRFGQCSSGASAGREGAISANPSEDTLTYSSQEWVSPDSGLEHTIYNNGVETVTNQDTHEDSTYDPSNNTLTTLTETGVGLPVPSGERAPLPAPADFQNPAYYKNLYREAQAGTQKVRLVGQTTVAGRSVYQLEFDSRSTPPAHPPAGAVCGTTVCTPPGHEILVYVDSQTFTPVRSVTLTLNTSNLPGLPEGTSVASVTDFIAQSLPDTSQNEALLQMSQHPGAATVKVPEAQSKAALGAWMESQIKTNQAQTHAETSARSGGK